MPSPALSGYSRPFIAQSDLAELADLIQIAFGEELRRTGNRMVEDMRQMATWGSLLNLKAGVWPLYSGQVWIEQGRIVGNVSFAREQSRGEWQLSNVAVYPEYRGRGIASRLCDLALEHIRAAGGQRVFLQVRSDNAIAHGIYARRGFRDYDTICELGLAPADWPLVVGRNARLRPMAWRRSRQIFEMAQTALPPARLQARPHALEQYRRSLWQRLSQVLLAESLGADRYYAADSGGHLLAFGRIWSEGGRVPAELELLVRPECRGQWEDALAGALLASQMASRPQLRAHLSTTHREATEALKRYGFQMLRQLDEMVLVL